MALTVILSRNESVRIFEGEEEEGLYKFKKINKLLKTL